MGWFDRKAPFEATLTSTADIDEAVAASGTIPQVLMKHSTRCPVSSYALTEVLAAQEKAGDAARFQVLDLLEHRDVSNDMAERFGVRHASPQVIVLRDREVVADASHGDITADWLLRVIGADRAT